MSTLVSRPLDISCCCGEAAAFLVHAADARPDYLCANCARSEAVFNGATEQLEEMIGSAVLTAILNWEAT